MSSRVRVVVAGAAMTLASVVGCVAAAAAQPRFDYIGPKQCTNCHDHDPEKEWYEKKEIPEVTRLFPDQKNAGHINSLKQLEAGKSDEFAKAVGLADKYDAAGSCVSCHATVWRGEANAGVSCESCHGPGSGYRDPHQKKDAYDTSVKEFGMTRLVGNFAGWTQQCTNCHVMTDDRLIAAGHPSGDDFDLGKKFVPVSLHFKKTYTASDVAGVARGEMQAVLRRRGRANATAVPPTAEVVAAPTPSASAGAAAPATAPPAASPPSPPAGTAADVPPAASSARAPVLPAPKPPKPPPSAAAMALQPRASSRPAPIDPASPPAGSPTSIEPPPPIAPASDAAAPAAAAPAVPPASTSAAGAPAVAPAVAVRTDGFTAGTWIAVGIVALALVGVAVGVIRKR